MSASIFQRRLFTQHDLSEVVAVTWLLVAISGTVVFGRFLGLRGWFWLGIHDLLCLIGVSWEFRQMWRRRRVRLANLPVPPINGSGG
jgi:hypothetical protein